MDVSGRNRRLKHQKRGLSNERKKKNRRKRKTTVNVPAREGFK
jgi:hypothetical protein